MAAPSKFERLDLVGGAVATTITGNITTSPATATIADATGWPDGTNGPFLVVHDRGESSEEKKWVASRSGTTLTYQAGGHGADGTSDTAHSANTAVEICIGAHHIDGPNNLTDQILENVTAGEVPVGDGANSYKLLNIQAGGTLIVGNDTDAAALDASGDAKIIVGNGTTVASVAVSGDVTIDNTGAVTIGADKIDGSNIADDAIDSEHYTDGSIDTVHLAADAVDGTKLADNAVDSEHYTDGSIDLAHMSANSVDSDQYVDGSIDTVHLAADAVDGTKLADDAVDSEHYTDGSIDTAHLSDGAVTLAKTTPVYDFNTRTAGDVTVNGTSFADIDNNLDLSVAAVAGDVLEFTVNGFWGTGTVGGRLDVELVTSGNYASGGATGGVRAWGGTASQLDSIGGSYFYTVVSGDIALGVVACRLQGRTSAAGNKTLEATTNEPLQFAVKNLGQ